ncbi:MAG: GNAT family N-acetyltransferase [Deltaproteobacteria bacterium]|nr:GNAT family N-acetyltransferase [Deltaproteobacteria bacterium]
MTTLSWTRDGRVFRAVEPDEALVAAHAETLRDWYNLPANAQLMGNTVEMTTDDVLEYWATVADRSARSFLLFVDGALAGDADLRNIEHGRAEYAVMIGPLGLQGQGLGRTFSAMVHVFGFRVLGLERVYVELKPENVRVHRMDLRLGYAPDHSPHARSLAEDPSAITMSIDRAAFERAQPEAMRDVIWS